MNFKNKTPTAYIICGFIGAGKTTFSRKLEKDTGAIRITKDTWMIKIFGNSPTFEKFEEFDDKVSKLSRDTAFQLLEKGIDVIIDEGFWVKSQREEMKRRVERLGAKAVLYYVKCPMEVMKKRTLERSGNPSEDSFKISGKLFEQYAKYWEAPTSDEGYILAI